jgi:hypothetical protein
VYVGTYINGKPEGYGEYLWVNNKILSKRQMVVILKDILKMV